jgi:hypothetical protein
MPGVQIDHEQWSKIESIVHELNQRNNQNYDKEQVLKFVIARGLHGLTPEMIVDNEQFQRRHNAVLHFKHGEAEVFVHMEKPDVAEVLSRLTPGRAFMLVVYGEANTGKTTFIRDLADAMEGRWDIIMADGNLDADFTAFSGAHPGLIIRDDADQEIIDAAWQDYSNNCGVILATVAPDLAAVTRRLYGSGRQGMAIEQFPASASGEPDNLRLSEETRERIIRNNPWTLRLTEDGERVIVPDAALRSTLDAQRKIAEMARMHGPDEGYVLVSGENCTGWQQYLDEPQQCAPGLVAFDAVGRAWITCGGDHFNGALAWLPVALSDEQDDSNG